MTVAIRNACEADARELTRIAFASKRHWNYPESYFDGVWTQELTIDEAYIQKSAAIFIAEAEGAIAGYSTLLYEAEDRLSHDVRIEKGYYIDHMFIDPPFIGKGIGALLIRTVVDFAKQRGIRKLRLFADPHAQGFYEKMGAHFVCDSPSSIPGRTIPVMEFEIA